MQPKEAPLPPLQSAKILRDLPEFRAVAMGLKMPFSPFFTSADEGQAISTTRSNETRSLPKRGLLKTIWLLGLITFDLGLPPAVIGALDGAGLVGLRGVARHTSMASLQSVPDSPQVVKLGPTRPWPSLECKDWLKSQRWI